MVKSIDRDFNPISSNFIFFSKEKVDTKEKINRYYRKYTFNIFKESF